jgi:hypothetical protein
MVAFRNTDAAGRTSGLLLRCVLYSLLALGLIVFDKRYDHLGEIRRFLSVAAYPVQVAVASPFEGWHWLRESVSWSTRARATACSWGRPCSTQEACSGRWPGSSN